MKGLLRWLAKSNRWKHLLGGVALSVCFAPLTDWLGVLAVVSVVGAALEWKDVQWGGRWDWVDWGLTMTGGVAGYLLIGIWL